MSKDSYIIKLDNLTQYEEHKALFTQFGEYRTITRRDTVWVLHRLTYEESQKIKALGITISYDGNTIKAD